MWFRNLQLYRLPQNWDMTIERLDEQLGRLRFRPCGSQDLSTHGWISRQPEGSLVHSVGGQWLIALGIERRLLPSSVVKQVAADRAEEIEQQQGYKPGRKQIKEIREAVTQELLPRAFTTRSRIFSWIDPEAGWLVVDASSRKAADTVVESLHKALDELPLKLLNTRLSPATAMTEWLVANEAPVGFTIDQDCELRAITEEKSAVRYVRHALDGKEVQDHIVGGKQASKLALTFDDRLSIILNDKLELKRLQFLDVVKDAAGDAEDAEALFDAEFALMTGELRRFIPAMIEALGGEEPTI
ncbi:recombination-associated protein RdgC [Uliginosibacterium sp. H3]|uniref:Recombination-associated protein RdgC n=1 Tax=Uliginosibacterium silvisoli TaxID=3114758 RepID=A0ABU6JYH6_9RHOO|nr:recombination-associated protein RdgC [Uliginosibacterium sp. H3]